MKRLDRLNKIKVLHIQNKQSSSISLKVAIKITACFSYHLLQYSISFCAPFITKPSRTCLQMKENGRLLLVTFLKDNHHERRQKQSAYYRLCLCCH